MNLVLLESEVNEYLEAGWDLKEFTATPELNGNIKYTQVLIKKIGFIEKEV